MSKKNIKELNFKMIAPYEVLDPEDRPVEKATMGEAIEFAKEHELFAVDIETTWKFKGKYKEEGLDPYLSKIVMFQFGTEDLQYIIDTRTEDITALLDILVTKTLVGQNLTFEYRHLLTTYNRRLRQVYDTMIVEQVLFNGLNKNVSLAALNKRYLNIFVDKTTRLEFAKIGMKPFTYRQVKYGAEDVLYPLLIRKAQLQDAQKKDLMNCLALEHRFLCAKAEISNRGLYFDKSIWTEAFNEALEDQLKLLDWLNNFVISHFAETEFVDKQLGLFGEGITCRIQWSSPKQVIKFFDYLGICPEAESKTTKRMTKTVESKHLQTVLTRDDLDSLHRQLITTYLKYTKSLQATSTFGLDFFKYINPVTQRIHTNYRQIMNTGRISSSKPNVQNIPSDMKYRRAFCAPKGYKIVNADYSGQEQICLVNKCLDKDLLAFYKAGHSDMHSFVAQKIWPDRLGHLSLKEVKAQHKGLRQIAKAAGFAINYGGTGFTIAQNLGIPKEQGEEVYRAYFKAFPGLKDYFAKCKRAAVATGYILIDDVTRRKFYFPKYKEMKHLIAIGDHRYASKIKGQLERASLNYPELYGVVKSRELLEV
jgi:DNA polymerase-1